MIEKLTLQELLLARQWLVFYTNVTNIEKNYSNDAVQALLDVDKQIWGKLISTSTPWGEVKSKEDNLEFFDEDFDDTVKELFKEEEEE